MQRNSNKHICCLCCRVIALCSGKAVAASVPARCDLPRRRRADRGYCAVPRFPRGTLTANEVTCMTSPINLELVRLQGGSYEWPCAKALCEGRRSLTAMGKEKDLSLIELWTQRAERAGEACQKAVAGRQWNGEGQYRLLEWLKPTEVPVPSAKSQCHRQSARRTGVDGLPDQGYHLKGCE